MEFIFGWKIPGVGQLLDGWAWSFLVLLSLLVGALEGGHRARAKRERAIDAERREIDRLIQTPQRRLAKAKDYLRREASVALTVAGLLLMSRIEGSAVTPESALGIERHWGTDLLEQIKRMLGVGRLVQVFPGRMGVVFPPPRDQAPAIYVQLSKDLNDLADRLTDSDLDPDYLHGLDEPSRADGAEQAAKESPQ